MSAFFYVIKITTIIYYCDHRIFISHSDCAWTLPDYNLHSIKRGASKQAGAGCMRAEVCVCVRESVLQAE